MPNTESRRGDFSQEVCCEQESMRAQNEHKKSSENWVTGEKSCAPIDATQRN